MSLSTLDLLAWFYASTKEESLAILKLVPFASTGTGLRDPLIEWSVSSCLDTGYVLDQLVKRGNAVPLSFDLPSKVVTACAELVKAGKEDAQVEAAAEKILQSLRRRWPDAKAFRQDVFTVKFRKLNGHILRCHVDCKLYATIEDVVRAVRRVDFSHTCFLLYGSTWLCMQAFPCVTDMIDVLIDGELIDTSQPSINLKTICADSVEGDQAGKVIVHILCDCEALCKTRVVKISYLDSLRLRAVKATEPQCKPPQTTFCNQMKAVKTHKYYFYFSNEKHTAPGT